MLVSIWHRYRLLVTKYASYNNKIIETTNKTEAKNLSINRVESMIMIKYREITLTK